jgi:inosine-uridine nucleoside N-ribohydrolase
MATPILIDTDMGVDDAVAITLALSTDALELVGITSVAGNVPLAQATKNIGRLLAGLQWEHWPPIGRGLTQKNTELVDATHIFAADGLGESDLAVPADFAPGEYLDVYEQLIETHGASLAILAIGPLTNLAGVLREKPDLLSRVGQIVVMGGAIWCKGNVTPHAEFNFYRDPEAAAAVLSAGLPVTVVPLDVTSQVTMDESHLAQLSRSGTRSGELLARMIRFPLEQEQGAPASTFLAHDALALGVLIWPELYMRANMGLELTMTGEQAGRTKPMVAKDKKRQVRVVISVNAADFLETLLEQLCHEKFVV